MQNSKSNLILTDTLGSINSKKQSAQYTVASFFFAKEFVPDGVKVNIMSEKGIEYDFCRKIFSDICFANHVRNRVNHATSDDINGKFYSLLFKLDNYSFTSYSNAFTPKNIKKDLTRAIDNLEEALNDLSELS